MSMLKTARLRPGTILLASGLVLGTMAACGGGAARYQGVPPEQLFQIATTEFQEGDHEEAVLVLDRLLLAHGDWGRIAEARKMLGDVYFAQEDFLTARAEYQRFLDRYAGHPASPEVALGICRSLAQLAPTPQRDQGYTQEAITTCRNVVIDYAGTQESADAARISNELRHTLAEKDFLNAEFYSRRNLWDAAIKYYEFVANLYPESEFAPRALLGLYHANQAIGYDDLADEARERLLDRYPDSAAAEELRANGSAG